MQDANGYGATFQVLGFAMVGLGLVVTIVMCLLGWLHNRGMNEMKEVKDVLRETTRMIQGQGERLAAGNEKFTSMAQRLDNHYEKIEDHEDRIRGLEKGPQRKEGFA